MKLKNMFGLCCTKGCHRKADFDIEIKAGEKVIKRSICQMHANELLNHCECDSIQRSDSTAL